MLNNELMGLGLHDAAHPPLPSCGAHWGYFGIITQAILIKGPHYVIISCGYKSGKRKKEEKQQYLKLSRCFNGMI